MPYLTAIPPGNGLRQPATQLMYAVGGFALLIRLASMHTLHWQRSTLLCDDLR